MLVQSLLLDCMLCCNTSHRCKIGCHTYLRMLCLSCRFALLGADDHFAVAKSDLQQCSLLIEVSSISEEVSLHAQLLRIAQSTRPMQASVHLHAMS